MTPFQMDDSDEITRQIQDAIASNSSLREGLDDDAATPLVEWGAQQAAAVGAILRQRSVTPSDEDAIKSTAYALARLMTRITWVVTYRDTKDAAWLTRTFNKINQLSQELYGPEAPVLSEDEIATWIASHHGQENTALIQQLIARLTPVSSAATDSPPPVEDAFVPGPEPTEAPATEAPDDTAPVPPSGTLFNGASLPGRQTKPPAQTMGTLKNLYQSTPDSDPPASPGGNPEHDE